MLIFDSVPNHLSNLWNILFAQDRSPILRTVFRRISISTVGIVNVIGVRSYI